uniref:Uncharacterized protein n=1 Tax=Oryza sativa subsp. japonica TaxID=39947 RepID=Q6ZJI0_ORYSJ|nr:hypothetical protein [Oryza sativa Japonica Group]
MSIFEDSTGQSILEIDEVTTGSILEIEITTCASLSTGWYKPGKPWYKGMYG